MEIYVVYYGLFAVLFRQMFCFNHKIVHIKFLAFAYLILCNKGVNSIASDYDYTVLTLPKPCRNLVFILLSKQESSVFLQSFLKCYDKFCSNAWRTVDDNVSFMNADKLFGNC